MSFTLPYKNFPDGQGGSFYSVVLPVSIALPARNSPRSKRFEACIDSGASSCLFHASIGRSLGFAIEQGDAQETMGISGPSNIYMHDVALYAPGGVIMVRAGFSDDLPILGLLGMSGFFDHFKITFDPIARACTLDRIFHVRETLIEVAELFCFVILSAAFPRRAGMRSRKTPTPPA